MESIFKVLLLLWFGTSMIAGQSSFFSTFSGPVSGEDDEISVPESAGFDTQFSKPSFDFVAKPDYSFGYGVHDPETGNAQKHEETRDGDKVRGQYSVLEPDGTLRTVTYTADAEHGFQATVHRKPPNKHHFQNFPSVPKFRPSLPDYTPPIADYTPPIDGFTPHIPDYTPSDYTPPISDYTPPISDYTPPISDYTPPISEYTPPISDYTPPVSDYTPPVTDYEPPISDYTPSSQEI